MTIEASSIIPDGTTFVAPTGGTAVAISLLGAASGGKVTAKYDTEYDFLTRTLFDFSVKDPVQLDSAPGGYTQARETVVIKRPITLTNGNRTVNTITITVSRDPETSAADLKAFRLEAGTILGASSMDDFFLSHDLR